MFYLDDKLAADVALLKKVYKSNPCIEYIIDNYKMYHENFHRVFLHSGLALGLQEKDFSRLIDLFVELELPQMYINDMSFFRDKIEQYHEAEQAIQEGLKNVTPEQIISFIEYGVANLHKNKISFDFNPAPEYILLSQNNFILSHYYEILSTLSQYKTFEEKSAFSFKNTQHTIYPILKLIANKYSLLGQILNVCVERNKPTPAELITYEDTAALKYTFNGHETGFPLGIANVPPDTDIYTYVNNLQPYMMIFNQWFYKPNEIQRDLSQSYLHRIRFSIEETIDLMQKSGFMQYDQNIDLMHFKGEKKKAFLQLQNELEPKILLAQIYSIDTTMFIYKEETYIVKELIDVYLKIADNADKKYKLNLFNFEKKSYTYFDIDGTKSLYRRLKLNDRDKKLIELFIWDLNDKKSKKSNQFKPIVKVNNLFYMLPSRIRNLTIENVIDSILSDQLIEKTLSQEKGINFENQLEHLFNKNSLKFFKLKKDELPNSPEIDGMFIYDNALFVYEAKASIIQQNIIESYDYLNSTISSKAYQQLSTRINYILANKQLLEQKFQIQIDPNKIFPLIVMNQATYTGYQGFTIEIIDKDVAIVDYVLLKYMIENNSALQWHFDEEKQKYIKTDRKLSNHQDLYAYLLQPYRDLKSIDMPTVQITEDGIAFFIVKEGEIDYFTSL